MIIGISGKKGSGKTTVANGLFEDATLWPVRTDHFARPIKEILEDVLAIHPDFLNGPEQVKAMESCYPTGAPPGERHTYRKLMQDLGMYFRAYDPDVWAKNLVARYQQYPCLTVVHDVRFPNEVKAIQQVGGKVLRLLRKGWGQDDHASETALDEYRLFDATINNSDMSVSETVQTVREYVKQWVGK